MTPQNTTCDYPVSAQGTRATLRIIGHADHLNCLPLKKFLGFSEEVSTYREIIVDFSECRAIDSTAIGLLARTALSLRKNSSRRLILANLHGASRRAAEQLGIGHIAPFIEMDPTDAAPVSAGKAPALAVDREAIRDAHAALVELSPDNRTLFADVMTFINAVRQRPAASA